MKILGKLFTWKGKNSGSEPLMSRAQSIGPSIDDVTNSIFVQHSSKLIHEPITYIIPGVWGGNDLKELDSVQESIYEETEIAVEKIMEVFGTDSFEDSQKFALEYMIKGLIISKITFMVEVLKNKFSGQYQNGWNSNSTLDKIDPIGRA